MAKFKRGNLNLKTDSKVILSTTLETFLKFDGATVLLEAPSSTIQLSSDIFNVDIDSLNILTIEDPASESDYNMILTNAAHSGGALKIDLDDHLPSEIIYGAFAISMVSTDLTGGSAYGYVEGMDIFLKLDSPDTTGADRPDVVGAWIGGRASANYYGIVDGLDTYVRGDVGTNADYLQSISVYAESRGTAGELTGINTAMHVWSGIVTDVFGNWTGIQTWAGSTIDDVYLSYMQYRLGGTVNNSVWGLYVADPDAAGIKNHFDGSLEMGMGTAITEFSIDGTLGGDSDNALPTEKAVKTYVDAQIAATDEHNELLGLQGGDSTAGEFYHLTQDIYDGLYSGSPIIGLGNVSGTNLEVDYGSETIKADISGTSFLNISSSLIRVGKSSGAGRIEISDTAIDGYVASSTKQLWITETRATLGSLVDTRIDVNSATGVARIYCDNQQILQARTGQQTFGQLGTLLTMSQDNPDVTIDANYVEVLNLAETAQTLGVSGDSRLIISQASDTVDIYCGATRVLDLGISSQVMGTITDSRIVVSQSLNTVAIYGANTLAATFNAGSVSLLSGVAVNEFSNDETLFDDSDTKVPTQKAVKTYVDALIGGETYSGIVNIPNAASTVVVVFDIPQPDENYSIVTNIVNETDSPPSIYGHMTTPFDANGFTEIFSGAMDSGNYDLHFIISRNDLESSSSSSSSTSSSSSSSSSSLSSSSESTFPLGWVQHFDNTEFEALYGNGTWTGTKWYSGLGGGTILLADLGTWADGYRPTHVRFAISDSTSVSEVIIRDKNSSELTAVYDYASNTSIEIPWVTTDGFEIRLYDEPFDWYITNIEFLQPVSSSSSSISSSSSSATP